MYLLRIKNKVQLLTFCSNLYFVFSWNAMLCGTDALRPRDNCACSVSAFCLIAPFTAVQSLARLFALHTIAASSSMSPFSEKLRRFSKNEPGRRIAIVRWCEWTFLRKSICVDNIYIHAFLRNVKSSLKKIQCHWANLFYWLR